MKIYTRHAVPGEKQCFEYWYDRSTRCWWAIKLDHEGYQEGDAFHAYTRGEIERHIDSLKRKYGPRRSCPGCKTHCSMVQTIASAFWLCLNCGHLERIDP